MVTAICAMFGRHCVGAAVAPASASAENCRSGGSGGAAAAECLEFTCVCVCSLAPQVRAPP